MVARRRAFLVSSNCNIPHIFPVGKAQSEKVATQFIIPEFNAKTRVDSAVRLTLYTGCSLVTTSQRTLVKILTPNAE
jgi:hypothetical protein